MLMLNNMRKTINILKNNIINVDNKLSRASKISLSLYLKSFIASIDLSHHPLLSP